ncbi:hypothetical protein BHM03_00048847 [Ensete ventricosum]|nr:hypothetical protein BHM03_00048847 [Ensete ventricosum]
MLSFFPSIAMVSSYSSSTLKEPRICDPSAAAARVSGTEAVAACAAMAFFYVAILYAPTLILRLPPPTSLDSFMIRRFACAAVSSAASVLACVLLLGVSRLSLHLLLESEGLKYGFFYQLGKLDDLPSILGVLGIRRDHSKKREKKRREKPVSPCAALPWFPRVIRRPRVIVRRRAFPSPCGGRRNEATVEVWDFGIGVGGGGTGAGQLLLLFQLRQESMVLLVEKLCFLPQPLVLLHDVAVLQVQLGVEPLHDLPAESMYVSL